MKNLDFALMLEIYGRLLTEKQRRFMEFYYWDDLSLGEISQNEGVTRQAVRDGIKRGEQLLRDFEKKLGLAEKISECRKIFIDIYNAAEELPETSGNGVRRITELAQSGSEIF